MPAADSQTKSAASPPGCGSRHRHTSPPWARQRQEEPAPSPPPPRLAPAIPSPARPGLAPPRPARPDWRGRRRAEKIVRRRAQPCSCRPALSDRKTTRRCTMVSFAPASSFEYPTPVPLVFWRGRCGRLQELFRGDQKGKEVQVSAVVVTHQNYSITAYHLTS